MTSEQSIENILKEQVNTYRVLNDLLMKERECLIKMDALKIEEISKKKDTVIMRLRLLEEERTRLIKKFVEDNDISSEINIEELGKLTGNSVFASLRSQLLSLLQGIEEMNKFNSVLIERSIKHIRTTTGFFSSFLPEHISGTTGTLLSKET